MTFTYFILDSCVRFRPNCKSVWYDIGRSSDIEFNFAAFLGVDELFCF